MNQDPAVTNPGLYTVLFENDACACWNTATSQATGPRRTDTPTASWSP